MKTQIRLIFIVILIGNYSCKKQDVCGDEIHVFKISEETKAWLPEEILSDKIKFQSEDGEAITLQRDTIIHKELDKSFSNPCGDGNKKETIHYERIYHRYSSGDTIEVYMSMNIVSATCGWDALKEVQLVEEVIGNVEKWNQSTTNRIDIGHLSIRSNLINISESDEICEKHFAKYNEEVEINGISFTDVYTDDRPGHENAEFPLAEIFFQKGGGIIGFTDEKGKDWRRIE